MPKLTKKKHSERPSGPGKAQNNEDVFLANSDSSAPTEQQIYDQIYQAIIEHQLPPRTKLGEEALCDVFKVSRPRIRMVLQHLAHENLVELQPNRGAYVAAPSVREAREVFAARRLLEPALIPAVVENATRQQINDLEEFAEREAEVQHSQDRQLAIRMSGDLHVRIAELSGNTVLTQFLRHLVSRTSLIIAMYEIPGGSGCNANHHERLVALIGRRATEEAADFMLEHLIEIENSLRLDERPPRSLDLKRVFGR